MCSENQRFVFFCLLKNTIIKIGLNARCKIPPRHLPLTPPPRLKAAELSIFFFAAASTAFFIIMMDDKFHDEKVVI